MNREEKRSYFAAYRASHNEERRAYDAAYHAAHKEENRAHDAAYYQENREGILARNAAYRNDHGDAFREKQRQEYAEFAEWLQILRTVNGCEDCETHEGALLHHHVDPSTKRCEISQMSCYSLDMLEDELEKCVVLCRSCHNRRHVAMKHEGRVSA